jgi:hypothetical protein
MFNYITAGVALWIAFDLFVVLFLLRGAPTGSFRERGLTQPVG